jgi:hypothetical protein
MTIAYPKTLHGEILAPDPKGGRISVKFRKWWRDEDGRATFQLDPFVVVASAQRNGVDATELKPGVPVTVGYITGDGGQPIAKTIVLGSCRGVPTLEGGCDE